MMSTFFILHILRTCAQKDGVVLLEAIKLSVEDSNVLNSITKVLYPTIAEQYNTTATGVERSIRHAIDLSWQRGELATLELSFGSKVYQAIVNKVVA